MTPVIILTALDQVSDRIEGLNAGADDYLVKPFDLAELSARIGSVARRYTGNPNPIVTHGTLEIDLAARSIRRDGQAGAADGARMGAVRCLPRASRPAPVQGAARGEALCLRHRDREQHDRGPCQPPAQEARRQMSSRRSAALATGWARREAPAQPAGAAGRLARRAAHAAVDRRRLRDGAHPAAGDGRGLRLRTSGNRAAPSAARRRRHRRPRGRRRDPAPRRDPRARGISSPMSCAMQRGAFCCSRMPPTRTVPAYDGPGFRQTATHRIYNDDALQGSIRIIGRRTARPSRRGRARDPAGPRACRCWS